MLHTSAEYPKAPLLNDVPHACLSFRSLSLLQQSLAIASLGSQALHLNGASSGVFLLMPFALGRTIARLSAYARLELEKPKPSWHSIRQTICRSRRRSPSSYVGAKPRLAQRQAQQWTGKLHWGQGTLERWRRSKGPWPWPFLDGFIVKNLGSW